MLRALQREEWRKVRWRRGLGWAADILVSLPGFLILVALAVAWWTNSLAGSPNLRAMLIMSAFSVVGGIWRTAVAWKRPLILTRARILDMDRRSLLPFIGMAMPFIWAVRILPLEEFPNPLVTLGGWLDPSEGRVVKLKVNRSHSKGHVTHWWVHEIDHPDQEFEVVTRHFEGDAAQGAAAHWEAIWHPGFLGAAWMEKDSLRVVPDFGKIPFVDGEGKKHRLSELRDRRIAILTVDCGTAEAMPKFMANLERLAMRENVVVLRMGTTRENVEAFFDRLAEDGRNIFPSFITWSDAAFVQAYPRLHHDSIWNGGRLYLFHGDGTLVEFRERPGFGDYPSLPQTPLFPERISP